MLPAWADVLILCALPLILLGVLLLLGDEDPGNGTAHTQEDGKRDGGSDPDEEPPDSSSADGPDDVLIAA
jgi:hypothetical protein